MLRGKIRLDYYEILQLPESASSEEIKLAYRRLALKHHPDRGGSTQRMQLINEAHEVLTKYKELYDDLLRRARQPVIVVVQEWHFAGAYEWTAATSSNNSTSATGF